MPKNLKVGLAGEYLAASHLARIFDDIFPASSSSRFDFLCHRKNINFKIQVKTSNSTFKKNNSDWVRWDIKKKISNKFVTIFFGNLKDKNNKKLNISQNYS